MKGVGHTSHYILLPFFTFPLVSPNTYLEPMDLVVKRELAFTGGEETLSETRFTD